MTLFFFCPPLYRHCDLQPGPPAQRQRQSDTSPPSPATASLPQHPARAFPRWGHTLHRLAGVQLLCVLQSTGSRHKLRSQPFIQSGDHDGPHPGVFGLGAGARQHLSGLFPTLLWGVDAQQRQQQAECGVTYTLMQGHVQTMVSHDIPHTLLWHLLLFYGDSGSSGIISNWIIFTYRKTSNLMLTGKNINLAFSKCIPQFGNISKGLSGNHINHLTFTLDYRWVLLLSEMISLFYLMNEKLEKQTYSQQWWHFPGGRCTCFLFKTWATE